MGYAYDHDCPFEAFITNLDEEGRVYIIFTLTAIRKAMYCSEKSAIKYLTELEEFGLIERIRQGLGKPSLIYVKNFIDQENLRVIG